MKLLQILMALAFVVLPAAGLAAEQCPKFDSARQAGTLKSKLIKEVSGIAASRKNADVLWVHNDSGDTTRVFAISKEGTLLGIYNITDANNRDWEDIAIGPGPDPNTDYLYIGDIGDNDKQYQSIIVYRIAEPKINFEKTPIDANIGPAAKIELKYPDGPVDAESLMVDPVTRDIYIISKQKKYAKVYLAAYPQLTAKATKMEPAATLPYSKVTAGDISLNGDFIIIRTYKNIYVWNRPMGVKLCDVFANPPCEAPAASEPQGEAVCFDSKGKGYFTVSEGKHSPIYYFGRKDPNTQATSKGK
jgi:hypothetical protein